MDETRTIWGRVIKLGLFLAIGVGCVVGSLWPDLNVTWQVFLATLGSTFIVIFGLGASVDWWMKKGILDDVVKASLGYILPKELRPAMRWVYAQHIICVKHLQTTEVTHNNNDPRTVTVRTRVVRTLENISGATETVDVLLGVEEWLDEGAHTEILELAYDQGDERKSLLGLQKREACAVRVDKQPVKLQKGETLITRATWQEVKRATDIQYGFYTYPTMRPTVIVKAPNDIEISAGFTLGHDQDAIRSLGEGVFELDATLLPRQPIGVSWYEKRKCEEWLNTPQKSPLNQPN